MSPHTETATTTLVARVQQHYDTYWQGDLTELDEQMAPDFVDDAAPDAPCGPETVRASALAARAVFPDMRVTVDDALVDANVVVSLATWRGTASGSAMGLPATERPISMSGIVAWQFDDHGRLVRRTPFFDAASRLREALS